MKKISTLLFLFIALNSFAQTTLILQPGSATGKSTVLDSYWPSADNSALEDFDAFGWTHTGTPDTVRSIVQFDLTSIPAGATIQTAILTLYNDTCSTCGHSQLSGSNAAWIQRITSSWNQHTANWNNLPSTTSSNEVALPASASSTQDYTINVTALVQDMIDNPSTSFGFMLRLQNEQYYRSLIFASCNHIDTALHPKLVITYITDCTTLVLQPDGTTGKHTILDSYWPTVDNSAHVDFDAFAWTHTGTPDTVRSIVQFDLSSIPVGAIIQTANLTLYNDTCSSCGHSQVSGSNAAWVQRITSSWNEHTANWSNPPTTTTLNETLLPASSSSIQDYTVNVTTLVQDMINNPSTSFGFMLRLQTEQYYRSLIFASSNHPDSALHPKLEICYTIPNCTNIVLQPDSGTGKHTILDSYWPTVDNSAHVDFDAFAWTHTGTPDTVRSIVQFDLTSIPAGSTIQTANLTLYNDTCATCGHSQTSGSNAGWIQRITSSWNQHTANWSNPPATTTVNEVNLPASISSTQDYTINVTSLVQDMIDNPLTSFGFMLRLQTEQYYRCLIFASSNHPDVALHPKLEICYTPNIGIGEVPGNNIFNIYPNPSTGNITISFHSAMQNGAIEIFNSIWQEIYSEKISNSVSKKEINLKAAAGIYFVKVSDGEKIFTKKLIIE